MVKTLYAVWVKIDEKLPWIELDGTYETRKNAQKAAKEVQGKMTVKIVSLDKNRKAMKALVTVKQ
ncbi:MAG: hypothetical protein ACPLKQ_00605 [Candidatus Bathyarchaeales archaeon]